jgi:DnaA family protein
MSRQLTLGIELNVAATFDSFMADGSAEAIAALRQVGEGLSPGPLWIYGAAGVGKSHLLQAACRLRSDRGGSAMYLPLAQAAQLDPAILEGSESIDLLAIDDIDAVAGDHEWEVALFSAINSFLLSGSPLLLAAGVVPRDVGFSLPDLSSRVGAHVVYRIAALSDEDLQKLVMQRASERGLQVDATAIQYLMRRVPRDMRVLEDWLSRLDRASLAAHKRVTVALIRSVLERDQHARD